MSAEVDSLGKVIGDVALDAALVDSIKGFLDPVEGERLMELAHLSCQHFPALEIGSYCGKSTVYLGTAVKACGSLLYAVDHHRGSEEHQPGEEYHDPDLFDAAAQRFDSLPQFRRTLAAADLEAHVVPIVSGSAQAARFWNTPLGLVFVDGGHSMQAALTDYRCWVPHVVKGGYLLIHDVFPNPADGGRPPFEIYELARKSGLFEDLGLTQTLGVLRKL